MPLFFANVIRGAFCKADYYLVLAFAGLHSETASQPLFEGKLLWTRKLPAGMSNFFNPSWNKSANISAEMVVSEQEPFAVDVGKVIRVNDSLLGLPLSWFAISQLQLLMG